MSLRCRMDFKNFRGEGERKRDARQRSTINPKIQLQFRTSRLFYNKCQFFVLFSFSCSLSAVSHFGIWQFLYLRFYILSVLILISVHRLSCLLNLSNFAFYSSHVHLEMDFDWIMSRLLHFATKPPVIIRNVMYSRNAYLSRAYNR